MALSDFVLDTTRGDQPINSNLAGDSEPNDQGKLADFLTIQSLTYSGALLAIGVIWALVQKNVNEPWWPAG